MIIGISGKSGSGKSTLAKEIIELTNGKAIHLDIDKVGHQVLLLPEVKNELINTFGNSVIKSGEVDRKSLGKIVFDSKDEMAKLTAITWKHMQIEIDKFLDANKDRIILLDWLLLINTNYFNMCNIKILLDIPYEVRKERAMSRDKITAAAFDLREKASIDFNESDFNYVIKKDDKNTIKRLVELL